MTFGAAAHDTPGLEHSHAFQKTGYGTYRQGHSVNGPLGSITIWSPQPYTGYRQGPAVKFARPQPITRPPDSQSAGTAAGQGPAPVHGRAKDGGSR
jgi:hypothetical protein